MSEAKTEMNEEKNRGHPMNSTTILVSFGFPPALKTTDDTS